MNKEKTDHLLLTGQKPCNDTTEGQTPKAKKIGNGAPLCKSSGPCKRELRKCNYQIANS